MTGPDDSDPSEIPASPPQDEAGVDLWQIEDHLKLTPAQRLANLEGFVHDIFLIWERMGITPPV
ncbi:MAG: hypothetical protein ABSH20_23170 [Tepidisphaeraceae bacterium]|jgi:hypothetical protein